MTDETAATIAAAPRAEPSSTTAQIAVLATLSAIGTLATNILLPSLPQMAASLRVTTAEVTASITGTVTDQSGAAVPGATVTAKSVERGLLYTAVTNDSGLLHMGEALGVRLVSIFGPTVRGFGFGLDRRA